LKPNIWKRKYGCIEGQPSLVEPTWSNMKDSAPVDAAASLPCRFFSRICLNSLQMISQNLSIISPKLHEKATMVIQTSCALTVLGLIDLPRFSSAVIGRFSAPTTSAQGFLPHNKTTKHNILQQSTR
jgi:hypothetical protein